MIEVEISTLNILSGEFPNRAKALVLEWATDHKNDLMDNWNLAKQNLQLNKIDPLK